MTLRFGILLVFFALSVLRAAPVQADERPNILFILADDLAWADLGCYGHPWHETPHLDRLASQGMRFTDGYAPAPICSASRASIMTGKSTARLGFEFVTKDGPGRQQLRDGQTLETPPFTLNLPLEETTVAEHLRDAGYETAFCGKWHLNAHHGGYLGWSPTHGPKQQGFQTAIEDFGSHPYAFRDRDKPSPISKPGRFPRDSMVRQASDFMKQDHDAPFFLMVSHFYLHTPVRTPCRWLLKKYESKVPEDSPNRQRRIEYAAFVETLDHYVGQLLSALDESGHAENTLVVFTSDNGGHPQYTANGPLRGSKWNVYEGGIRVPLIARWPGEIAAGTTCSTPAIGYDLLPTFAHVAGVPSDAVAPDLDGVNLAPVFRDETKDIARSLYWHFPYYHPEGGYEKSLSSIGVDDFAVSQTRPQSAMRRGAMKLVYFYEDERGEQYDLSQDPGESRDLSRTRDAVALKLEQELLGYLNEVGARFPERAR